MGMKIFKKTNKISLNSKILQVLILVLILYNFASAQNKTDYSYSREGKDFHVFNSAGQDISDRIVHISNFNSLFYFVFDPETKTLLKLSYLSATQNKISVAEKLFEGKDPNYVYIGDYDLYFYCEGKVMTEKDVLMSTPNRKIFVISPKDSNYSYSFQYSNNEAGMIMLERLPPNRTNYYWSKTLLKDDVSKTDFVVYANGGSPENFEGFKIVSDKFIFSIKDKYYKIENYKTSKLYVFNELHQISKEEYDNLIQNEQQGTKVSLSTESNVSVTENKKKTTTNFGCNTDGTCLVKYFNTRIPKLIAEGKTKEDASKIAGEELDSVFKREPELGYFVVIKINQDYLIGLMGGLSTESRAQMRAMAMKEVKAYVDKYGAKEIKTVPYKPKKKNDNK